MSKENIVQDKQLEEFREAEAQRRLICVRELESALNQIYALYGEDERIKEITQQAIRKYGLNS